MAISQYCAQQLLLFTLHAISRDVLVRHRPVFLRTSFAPNLRGWDAWPPSTTATSSVL